MSNTGGRRNSRGGQAVILVIAAMGILLIGALGLAIDGGQMYAQRQMAQNAADAAAQAGAMSLYDGTNSTATYPFGTGTPPLASSVCTTTDGRTPCVYARDNGFGGTSNDTVTLSFPTSVSGVTLTTANVPALTVTVQRTLKTGLIRMVGGPATTQVTAKATAGLAPTGSPDCVYALDPASSGAFVANNAASVTLSNCALIVDSSSSSAANISGGATVSASAIQITGGAVFSGGGSSTPAPTTGVAVTADPFSSLPSPAAASCLAHPLVTIPLSNATLTPGTYCGGITILSNVTGVTFSAGTYIIYGGGISFGSGSSSTGSGVMFYLTGLITTFGTATIYSTATVTFSAPTSGSYLGVLFYQDRSLTTILVNPSFAGGSTMQLTGSLYFPNNQVSFSNGVSVATTTAIVAKQVSFAGGANISRDSTGSKTGLFSSAVALVQ